jgi:cytochrome P450
VSGDRPGFQLRDLASPENLRDPYPTYRALLQAEIDDDPARLTHRVLTRHADVSACLRDQAWSSDRIPTLVSSLPDGVVLDDEVIETLRRQLPFADPPDHTRIRGLVQRAFTPRTIATMQERVDVVTSSLVASFAERVRSGEPCDFMAELAYPLPVLVLTEVLGVPPQARDDFKRWATTVAGFVGAARRTGEQAAELTDVVAHATTFLNDLRSARIGSDADDLFTALVAMTEDGDRLDGPELVANFLFLLVAGHETATNHLGNSLLLFLRHPDQLARLRADRSLIGGAIEETLRMESPVQSTARIARADTEIAGRQVRAGQSAVLVLGAANRDPDMFESPDSFDIGRTPNRHVAFSSGVHFCLGAALARMEAAALFNALCDEIPVLEAAASLDDVVWLPTIGFRGPSSLMVKQA